MRLARVAISFFLFTIPATGLLLFTPLSYSESSTEELDGPSLRVEGYIAQQQGDWERAVELYKKAIRVAPEYPLPYNDLGIIYERMARPEEAEASYLEAVRVDPTYAKAHANLAMLYESLGRLDDAAIHWEKRAKLGEEDAWTVKAQGRLKAIREGPEGGPKKPAGGSAAPVVQTGPGGIVAMDMAVAGAHYNEAMRLEREKMYEEALQHLGVALDHDPWNRKTIEAIHRVKEAQDRSQGTAEPGRGKAYRSDQIFLTTSDIKRKYEIIGVVTAISDGGDLEEVNNVLRQRALARGADGLILVHYLSHKDQLHGYGTAVELR